jgi:hypothetical protein
VPLERATAEAINAGALRARCSISLTPEVIVDGVSTGDLVVPLAAVVCTLLDGSGGCGEGEGCRAGEKEGGKLHDEWTGIDENGSEGVN